MAEPTPRSPLADSSHKPGDSIVSNLALYALLPLVLLGGLLAGLIAYGVIPLGPLQTCAELTTP